MCKAYNEGIRDSNLSFYLKDPWGGLKGTGPHKMCFQELITLTWVDKIKNKVQVSGKKKNIHIVKFIILKSIHLLILKKIKSLKFKIPFCLLI